MRSSFPPRSSKPNEPPSSSTFFYSVWCNSTANHQLKLQQNDFGNLYPTPYIKLFIHSCGHARPQERGATNAVASLQCKVTQLGLYVMSARLGIKKDIRGYTTQYAQGLELHVALVRLEDKEGNPCPWHEIRGKKNLNVICRSKHKIKHYLIYLHLLTEQLCRCSQTMIAN